MDLLEKNGRIMTELACKFQDTPNFEILRVGCHDSALRPFFQEDLFNRNLTFAN